MKKVLITGGNGFIARSLAREFVEKYDLTVCSRSELDLLNVNHVSEFLRHHHFDVIIHTATYDAAPKGSKKAPSMVLEYNMRMFTNLVRCEHDYGKLLYFGSGAEFSRPHWIPKMRETFFDKHVPQDQYGYSKYLMTKIAESKNNIINLRLFGVFGELDDWRYRFLSNICCHALKKQSITVQQNAKVDFLYIKDLIKVVQWFVDYQPQHSVYNVCSGMAHEYTELAASVAKLYSSEEIDVVIHNQQIRHEYSGDNSLLLKEIPDLKLTPIQTSLSSLLQWYQAHQDEIDPRQFHY